MIVSHQEMFTDVKLANWKLNYKPENSFQILNSSYCCVINHIMHI